MPGPLAGLRVVDLTRALAGPFAAMLLGDLGADVIKVEMPGIGDITRSWGPPFVGPSDALESTYFLAVNRGKKSVELNLRDAADRKRLLGLLESADVLIENFAPGVPETLGLNLDAIAASHPRLVLVSITGFGDRGPDRHRPGFDQILQGEVGISWLNRTVDGRPQKSAVPVADLFSGSFAAMGVLAALYERGLSGKGQRVATSLLSSMIAIHTFHATRWLIADQPPGPNGNYHPHIAPYGTFRCRDGVFNIAVGTPTEWRQFAEALNIDPETQRFESNSARVRHVDELASLIEERLQARSVDEWIEVFDGLDVPVGRIRTLDEVYDWEQVRAMDLVDEVEHPTLGTIRLPGPPITFSRSAPAPRSAPPTLGQHQFLVQPALPVDRE